MNLGGCGTFIQSKALHYFTFSLSSLIIPFPWGFCGAGDHNTGLFEEAPFWRQPLLVFHHCKSFSFEFILRSAPLSCDSVRFSCVVVIVREFCSVHSRRPTLTDICQPCWLACLRWASHPMLARHRLQRSSLTLTCHEETTYRVDAR
jgi:hypothetical protein